MNDPNTYTYGPASGNNPQQIVILLHGLGADGRDLIGLAPELAPALPDAVFLSPDAPQPCDMAPMGYQWFSLQDRTPAAMLAGVQAAAPGLADFIDAVLEKYNLPPEKLALLGFSQGTMMSLYVGPRLKRQIAGIVGFSGALLWEEELPDNLQKPPVCLIHGTADTVVPVEAYHHAKDRLTEAGFTVSGHTCPGLPHGIDQQGIETARQFLKQVLS